MGSRSAGLPVAEVLRHLRKIIAPTGMIDRPMERAGPQVQIVIACLRHAHTKLINDQVKAKAETDEATRPLAERSNVALDRTLAMKVGVRSIGLAVGILI